jgi:SagB-type dehydrogenase family enzyme
VTDAAGHRTAPSAGATYPLEVYAVTAERVSRYLPGEHALSPVGAGDVRPELAAAAIGQETVATAPLVMVITGVVSRTAARYGTRAERYVWMEAGHAAQNVLLQAVALGLGAVPVGAFDDDRVRAVVGAPADEKPLYLVPVGHPAE